MWTLIAILLNLWLVGMLTSMSFGGLLHLLLVLIVILAVYELAVGRRRRLGRA